MAQNVQMSDTEAKQHCVTSCPRVRLKAPRGPERVLRWLPVKRALHLCSADQESHVSACIETIPTH